MVRSSFWRSALVALMLLTAVPFATAHAASPANQYFERTWARTDRPVMDQQVNRTWMWGPEAFTAEIQEPFRESPGGVRRVQYFDKSRMEISDIGESTDSLWYVTNGLLVVEMMTGQLQTGLNDWESRQPADVNVAGDADDSLGATYRYFGFLTDLPAKQFGSEINEMVSPGSATNLFMYNDTFLVYGATAAYYVPETGHSVASPFWSFLNSTGLVFESGSTYTDALFVNPFYATGFPVTEAYWAVVKVGGVDTDVLIQCFERRCLTYTPSNSDGWQVEAGNVGQHYRAWRYSGHPPLPPDPLDPPPTPDPLPDIIADFYWLNPENAVLRALDERGSSLTGPFADAMLESAWAFHARFNMLTAAEGKWNHDTRPFYPWLVDHIQTGMCSSGGFLYTQVMNMIYEPSSEIARRIRQFEVEYESGGYGLGQDIYYVYMHTAYYPPVCQTPMTKRALEARWQTMSLDYSAQRYSDGGFEGFAAFLASRGYEPPWGYD